MEWYYANVSGSARLKGLCIPADTHSWLYWYSSIFKVCTLGNMFIHPSFGGLPLIQPLTV